jgi:hypothetical protein
MMLNSQLNNFKENSFFLKNLNQQKNSYPQLQNVISSFFCTLAQTQKVPSLKISIDDKNFLPFITFPFSLLSG